MAHHGQEEAGPRTAPPISGKPLAVVPSHSRLGGHSRMRDPFWGPSVATGPEKIAFIKPGVTTRSEVKAILGSPDAMTIDESLVGYSCWESNACSRIRPTPHHPYWLILTMFGQDDLRCQGGDGKRTVHTSCPANGQKLGDP